MTAETARKTGYGTRSIILIYTLGISIRYWLINSRYQSIIGNHIEVSTPLNSWRRVLEGLYLQSKDINPYDGDLLHEAPLTMFLYKTLTQTLRIPPGWMFLCCDALTAVLLYWAAKRYMFQLFVQQEESKRQLSQKGQELCLSGVDFVNSPIFVLAAFLINPYTIFNCVGFSTTVFHNFFLTLFIFSMLHGSLILSTLSLAICTMISFYPVILIIPLFLNYLYFFKDDLRAAFSISMFMFNLVVLKIACSHLSGGDAFIRNVYGFILTVPDLRPNVGLFWYFFTEMFDHFRELFICSFQINATVLYLIPLSIKFRKDPLLLTFALLFLVAIFKSYPCIGDIGYVASLIPCFTHLFTYSQQGFLVGVTYLITSCLGPILWHLWIYAHSANANFYFGVTLAFAIAQIFLLTDILFAYLKREFSLKYGKERRIKGKEALLVLE